MERNEDFLEIAIGRKDLVCPRDELVRGGGYSLCLSVSEMPDLRYHQLRRCGEAAARSHTSRCSLPYLQLGGAILMRQEAFSFSHGEAGVSGTDRSSAQAASVGRSSL